jgi:putative transposase
MTENSNVVPLRLPDEIDDPLTNILRSGARQLLAQAVEMEAEAFLAAMKGFKLADGRNRVVRHGHGPVRTIQTGIGAQRTSMTSPGDPEQPQHHLATHAPHSARSALRR